MKKKRTGFRGGSPDVGKATRFLKSKPVTPRAELSDPAHRTGVNPQVRVLIPRPPVP
jgi:hypothetical protein